MTRWLLLPLLSAALAAPAGAQMLAREGAIKAAFIAKFGSYVDWPAGAGGPVTVCAVGRDMIGAELERAAAGQQVAGRPLTVRKLARIGRGDGCDIAYLSGSDAQSVAQGLAETAGAPVLTVTDSRWGGARGTVHFQLSGGRVRFHIDDAEAARRGAG